MSPAVDYIRCNKLECSLQATIYTQPRIISEEEQTPLFDQEWNVCFSSSTGQTKCWNLSRKTMLLFVSETVMDVISIF